MRSGQSSQWPGCLRRLVRLVALALFTLVASTFAPATRAADSAKPAPDATASTASSDTTSTTPAAAKRFGGKPADDFGLAQVRTINDAIRQGWADHQLAPSPAAT